MRDIGNVIVLEDGLARTVFLVGHKVDRKIRLTGRCSEVECIVWLAAGVCGAGCNIAEPAFDREAWRMKGSN